jgi:hypothetical protein
MVAINYFFNIHIKKNKTIESLSDVGNGNVYSVCFKCNIRGSNVNG